MSQQLITGILSELESLRLIDPHTHINPHAAASSTLADIMGYHYYTELAHSAGLPKDQIEDSHISPKEKVARLIPWMKSIQNTAQYSWLVEMCRTFFDFTGDYLDESNWEPVYDTALAKMSEGSWEKTVLELSGLDGVFLTNDFDDSLSGFDTSYYIPCLRTDDLVFHLGKADVRRRLCESTNSEPQDSKSLRSAIGHLFQHFHANNAKACAISLPPDFSPQPVSASLADEAIAQVFSNQPLTKEQHKALSCFVFWTLAEYCQEFALPFDLMIGVNRRVFENGVFQGQDLYDKRVSLIQYQQLFNAFPQVTFPISVLAETSNQELVSYAWIFPNVVTNGHWWYSNIPVYIERDTRGRLQAVPQTKQIGYYSDMYKLEFALPKFSMYRRILAKVLAEDYVIALNWSEADAIELGRKILRSNVEAIFGV